MPFRHAMLIALAAVCCGLAACDDPPEPRLAGLLLAGELDEASGLAASQTHRNVLWLLEDGGNPAQLHAINKRGTRLASFNIEGVANTDWEDLAAFELDGKRYLLIADTGDNGGLRRTLLLHAIVEPKQLKDGETLRPVWSIAFRWPDGARDCEAVTVDAARRQILLISKKRQPPELFVLPLRPHTNAVQTARRVGKLAGVPQASAEEQRTDARGARIRRQVTAAALAPDGRTLAVLTYQNLLLYPRRTETWAQALAHPPQVHGLPWLHQPEALSWAANGRGLYATGEFSPAPLLYIPVQP
jgi:hypothetical protein